MTPEVIIKKIVFQFLICSIPEQGSVIVRIIILINQRGQAQGPVPTIFKILLKSNYEQPITKYKTCA